MNRWDYYDDAGESNPPLHRSLLVNKDIMDPLPFPEVGTWRAHSACRHEDVTTFFATGEAGYTKEIRKKRLEAVAICKGCPVSFQCLRFAVKNDIRWGVWGGKDMQSLDKVERISLRKIFNK
jgi:WhiB family redox-sensing transcriptional regulator